MEKQKTHLTEHQTLLLEMLHDFDQVCRNHNIHYQLFAGTALGAVRHGGFIPWDDDIDVILMRDEYERFFREAAGDFDPSVYYVQKDNSPHWPMQFSKLRRNGTACMEKYHPKDKLVHQGVYIDIFPCDNLANGGLIRRLQFAASKVVIAKALYARGYETNSIAKKLFMQFCRVLPRRPLEEFCIRRKDTGTKMVHSFLAASKSYKKNLWFREWFNNTMEIQFEDFTFPVSRHYDALLRNLYGDYHRIPSPEERKCKEHAAILDLEHSYTEYLDKQATMSIQIHTKCIR